MNRTKIVATLGPASSSADAVAALIDAGADVFRLNFSHGTLDEHLATFDRIRGVCREKGATIAVMADLCGPKIRVGRVGEGGFEIAPGDRLTIVADDVVGDRRRISTNRPQLVREVRAGHRVLIDDGTVLLRVEQVGDGALECACEIGGWIRDRKGINVPDSDLDVSALTAKDRADLAALADRGVDYVALSFVRTAADLAELRELLPLTGPECRVVAKIETWHAMNHLDEIIESADVVLVARGDLGVEMDVAGVPLVQKRIARACQQAGKPVIIATQMLQSMVERPVATRAEVSDVANAILDTADCVMLSAETAIGQFPVEAVRTLSRVAAQTEAYLATVASTAQVLSPAMRRVTTAVSHGANLLARDLDARAVVVWTETGNTARLLSKHRLSQPVVALSPDEYVCRRMAMYYGVQPMRLTRRADTSAMLADVDRLVTTAGVAARGDMIVVVAGTHLDEPGATNSLLIHLVGDCGGRDS